LSIAGETAVRAMVLHGKAEDLLPALGSETADSVICDPPYGLAPLKTKTVTAALAAWLAGDRMFVPDGRGFMSADWDRFVPPPGIWDECYRILKPGSWLLAFAAPRTADLMGLSIRLAGFEVTDSLHWINGEGFPKARSRLKPAHEPIIMAWKPGKASPPLPGIDGCRIRHASAADLAESQGKNRHADFASGARQHNGVYEGMPAADRAQYDGSTGRWPPNLLLTHDARCSPAGTRRVRSGAASPLSGSIGYHGGAQHGGVQGGTYAGADGTEAVQAYVCEPGCPVAVLNTQSGESASRIGRPRKSAAAGNGYGMTHTGAEYADAGGASRFFPQLNWDPDTDDLFRYCAKAPPSERPRIDGKGHPTCKPLAVMRWLARLVTPPGGLILDPFAGTGTTVQAALAEGFRVVGTDSWDFAIELARVRLADLEGVVFG
jgi:DNA modification methylase